MVGERIGERRRRGTDLRLTPKAILRPVPVKETALLPTSILLRVTLGGRTYCLSVHCPGSKTDGAYKSDRQDDTQYYNDRQCQTTACHPHTCPHSSSLLVSELIAWLGKTYPGPLFTPLILSPHSQDSRTPRRRTICPTLLSTPTYILTPFSFSFNHRRSICLFLIIDIDLVC